jgi:hypothetical protein
VINVIRDRGNIKWTAMMLPEHVELLREWKKEDAYQTQPELDEQRLEEMNELICEAMEFHDHLKFTYHHNRQLNYLTGHIHYIDEVNGELRIVDEQETIHRIKVSKIVDLGRA